ncbi:MAG: hypothetical protein NVS9B3_04290 [Gemmatimonadaceae bacterium]
MPERRDDDVQPPAPAGRFPELTRGLRRFGSTRGGAGEGQTHFFAPLLAARREVERAADQAAQLRAFDGAMLRATWTRWIRETAAARCPRDDAECRALVAHLGDEMAPLLARVTVMVERGGALRAAASGDQEQAWQAWTEAVLGIFVEADAAWERVARIISGWEERPRTWWRRAWGRVAMRGGPGPG